MPIKAIFYLNTNSALIIRYFREKTLMVSQLKTLGKL